MSTVSVELPDSLHEKMRELAARDHISVDQFITVAVAEKMSALLTSDYLRQRAQRGSRSKFERVLAKVPDVAPVPGDEWPAPPKRPPLTRRSRPRPKAGRA
jgi:predicted transcriptional regulator